jgi:hypothetical protein
MAHNVTVTVDESQRAIYTQFAPAGTDIDAILPATAVCSEGDWDGSGQAGALQLLADLHEAGTDRPPEV